jgi:hypothetical protein
LRKLTGMILNCARAWGARGQRSRVEGGGI